MPEFSSDGLQISYYLAGSETGPPVVLVHGFASGYELNWVTSRWQHAVADVGHRVIGIDCRGHGHSDKPLDPARYSLAAMAGDVVGLLDHLDVAAADYLGYSMGARIGLLLAIEHPQRVGRVVLAGLGQTGAWSNVEAIARRLRGDASVADPIARRFYEFAAARPLNDLDALAACMLGEDRMITDAELNQIHNPVLVVAGDQDDIAPDAASLAVAIPGARYVELPGRDHMNALPARQFKQAVVEFLS